MKRKLIYIVIITLQLTSCSISSKISHEAKNNIFKNDAFSASHTGISIYEPSTGKYWYNYQGDKYFVPASNTKIVTCYAAMKYLGDSLIGIKYIETGDTLIIIATGDPTFLHRDFKNQRVYNFLKSGTQKFFVNMDSWQDHSWGNGWSWDDYNDDYAAERSVMPMYGNILRLDSNLNNLVVSPPFFKNNIRFEYRLDRTFYPRIVHRDIFANDFAITETSAEHSYTETPFYTGSDSVLANLLSDTLHRQVTFISYTNEYFKKSAEKILCSQPIDSMLKPMMYRSDNFFAEQSLLMVSNKLLGIMNDEKIIDTLLKTDFKDLAQKPVWVDGSGLSHYNLFSPQDFIAILNKMKIEFGMDRIKNILPTGGSGTIATYYKADSSFIYAKTGTLSGVVALSGFLYTKKSKLLIFSILVNNHRGNPSMIRRSIEKFIKAVRNSN